MKTQWLLERLGQFKTFAKPNAAVTREASEYFDNEQVQTHRNMRKVYLDAVNIDFNKKRILYTRSRQEEDTLRKLRENFEIAGVIQARDEFPELNIAHPDFHGRWLQKRIIRYNGISEPWTINLDDDEQEIKVVCNDLIHHAFRHHWHLGMLWTRFIPGRPNPMKMKVVADEWEKSEAKFRGARIEMQLDYVDCNVFSETYPRVLRANLLDMVPGGFYRIGDLRRDLPDGIELAPKYDKSDSLPIFKFEKTVKTIIYDEYLNKSYSLMDFHKIESEMMDLHTVQAEEKKEVKTLEDAIITKADDLKLRKLAHHLGKDYETLKADMLKKREKAKAKLAKKK